ncbi:pentapeptide repeat-containing protein [Pseudoxanthomonas sp. PXM03]|nr:pentapeptide repeat-containing protein [Pseudoxanthomonas sp. PXM03]
MNSTVYPERPGRRIESIDFPSTVSDEDFSNCRLEWCRGKKVRFVNCKFSSALIKNCYFHRAEFIGCDFTGCTISESNLRGARFSQCDFKYSFIKSSPVEARQLLENLPHWENARREFLRYLRKNAESLGDVEDARAFLQKEMDASSEHWRSAQLQVQPYYRQHYPGWKGKISSSFKRAGIFVGKHFWGHGDSPFRLIVWIVIWLLFSSAVISFFYKSDFKSSVEFVSSVMMGYQRSSTHIYPWWISFVIAFSRFLFLGLLAAVLVRRYARR